MTAAARCRAAALEAACVAGAADCAACVEEQLGAAVAACPYDAEEDAAALAPDSAADASDAFCGR